MGCDGIANVYCREGKLGERTRSFGEYCLDGNNSLADSQLTERTEIEILYIRTACVIFLVWSITGSAENMRGMPVTDP